MPIRTTFKQISNQLTKLWNPGNYYYAKQQEVCKEKFKLFETIKTSKNVCDDFFRDSTKRRLEILDGKIDNYSNKWNEVKTRTSSKQRKKLTTQKNTLIELDLDFYTLDKSNLLSLPTSDKKPEINEYVNSIFTSINKHINLIDKQLDLQKTQINQDIDNPVNLITKNEQTMPKNMQQENKGLDSPKTKKRFKDIIKNESDIYKEALKNLKNVQISSEEMSTVKRMSSLYRQ